MHAIRTSTLSPNDLTLYPRSCPCRNDGVLGGLLTKGHAANNNVYQLTQVLHFMHLRRFVVCLFFFPVQMYNYYYCVLGQRRGVSYKELSFVAIYRHSCDCMMYTTLVNYDAPSILLMAGDMICVHT